MTKQKKLLGGLCCASACLVAVLALTDAAQAANPATAQVTNSGTTFSQVTSTKGSTSITFYLRIVFPTVFTPPGFGGAIVSNNNLLARYDVTGDYTCSNVNRRLAFPSKINVTGYQGTISTSCAFGVTAWGGRSNLTIR